MYEGNVFSIPGSGSCVKGSSSTPRFSMWSKSFAYEFRFFLPAIPVPAPEGSHSFLTHRAHLWRSEKVDTCITSNSIRENPTCISKAQKVAAGT